MPRLVAGLRLFVAVHVPSALLDEIDRTVVDVLRPSLPDVRWTRPEGRHLTLAFLGQMPEDSVPQIAAALEEAVAGHHPFEAAFGEVGGFPNLKRPRVVWVGLAQGSAEMAALARDVQSALMVVGYEPENRPFAAHLTLGRVKVPKPVGELPAVRGPEDAFAVEEVVLFRSQLHPHGARYTALEHVSLGD